MDKISEKIVVYSKIGEVQYLKKKGIKRVSIVVKPFRNVVVTVPYAVSYSDAERFVMQKTEWIEKAKGKMAKLESKKTVFSEAVSFSTKTRTLLFIKHNLASNKLTAKISEDKIIITVPESVEIESLSVQNFVAKAIEQAWVIEAKDLLPRRIVMLAEKYGFKFNKLAIKKIRSRWGSCSSANNINLSVYLMNIPDNLIDYVILHELCHTVEKNHGPKFWKLLDHVTNGNAKLLAKEMKKYSTRFF
jgi:predicted metal-dependent hydrolase